MLLWDKCLTLARGACLQTTDDGLARDATVPAGATTTCIAILEEAILIVTKVVVKS